MSNPTATLGFLVPEPGDPTTIRQTFTRIVFENEDFGVYADATDISNFDPTDKGEVLFRFQQLGAVLDGTSPPAPPFPLVRPEFVSDTSWKVVQQLFSGGVTANHSVMPKIIIPSTILVDNGLAVNDDSNWAHIPSTLNDLFNWNGIDFNGLDLTTIFASDFWKYAHIGGSTGHMYISTKAKDDLAAQNSLELAMINPANPPVSADWDETTLVVGGAFVLMLNVTNTVPAGQKTTDADKNKWTITIEFGEVTMKISESGALQAQIGANGEWAKGNLAEGKTKEGIPQQKDIEGKEPYILLVYPVWNGLVIQSGGQDSRGVIQTSSTPVRKLQNADILSPPYSNGFDPNAPAVVEVGVGTPGGPDYVLVDFDSVPTPFMWVTAENCRYELAYLPCFFSKACWFDHWMVNPDDVPGQTEYTFSMWPIWTANNTDFDLAPVVVTNSGYVGPIADTHYWYAGYQLEDSVSGKFQRFAGEIFGAIFEVDEEREFPIKNGNGSFSLGWSGGTPGGSGGDWWDYIQSINVSIGIDGSSGSIVVDKYGIAGQDAVAIQKIGAITVAMKDGYGTVDGSVFQGLAMGVSDAKTSGSATWTIPLFGLEKKLDDIVLINVPYFDGRSMNETLDYLTRYAGIIMDMSGVDNPSLPLSSTSNVNSVRFDWKTGTTVRTAIEDVMKDTQSTYVVRDGKIYFYTLSDMTGLPTHMGPNRSTGYTDTRISTVDRNPDFENLRNMLVVLAQQEVPDGEGTEITDIPTFPRMATKSQITTPDVPWAKCIVESTPGMMDETFVEDYLDKLAAKSLLYDITGSLTIAGNADIKPYDQWAEGGVSYLIKSVTHNLDCVNKTWTTSMEFQKSTL